VEGLDDPLEYTADQLAFHAEAKEYMAKAYPQFVKDPTPKTAKAPKVQAKVTRDSLKEMVSRPDQEYVGKVIGRALVAIFKRQTEAEKKSNATLVYNDIGFAGCDAKSGTITAKTFMKYGHLLPWQIEKWLKVGANGYPRICKYHAQLNEIAMGSK